MLSLLLMLLYDRLQLFGEEALIFGLLGFIGLISGVVHLSAHFFCFGVDVSRVWVLQDKSKKEKIKL